MPAILRIHHIQREFGDIEYHGKLESCTTRKAHRGYRPPSPQHPHVPSADLV